MRKLLWGIKTSQSSIQNAQVTGAVGEEGRLFFRYAVAVLAVFFCLHSSISTAATDKKVPFNIPQQRADQALTLFAEQANLTLVFPFEKVNGKTANRLVGDYPIGTAATILLQDTGLTAQFSDQFVLNIAIESKGKREMNNLKNKRKNLLASMVTIFATTGGLGQMAVAQGDEVATKQTLIDEIVVTAQKREQRLIDVPISISVVDEELLKNASIQSISDLSYLVPNLSVRETNSGSQNYVIRGIGNTDGNPNAALVGVYLDDMPLSFGRNMSVDLQPLDMARVEVLKGPQGTLYGAGSVGGTIRYVSNMPSFDGVEGVIGVSFSDTAGGDAGSEVTAVANLPVIEDEFAFRIATTYQDRGGWIDKINDPGGEEDFNGNELTHTRLRALWQLSDNFTTDISFIRHRNEAGGQYITNIGDNGDSQYQVIERNGLPLADTDFSNDYDLYSLTLNYDLGWARLVSASSQVEAENVNGSTSSPTGSFSLRNDQEKSAFTQEIRLVGDGNQLHWVVGAFYSDIETITDTQAGSGTYLTSGDPLFLLPESINESTSESYALFGDMAYDITEQLTLALGTRYFEDKQSLLFISGGITFADDHASFDKLSSKMSLSYSLSDSTTLYASASQGFRSGGFNAAPFPAYGPEEVNAFELGAKAALLDGRLKLESALFFSQYDDYIMFLFDPSSSLSFSFQNGGEAEIQGVEVATQFQLTENLTLGLSGNITETEFVTVTTPALNVGDPISRVPKYSYSANVNYRFDWSSETSGFLYLGYSRQGPSTAVNRFIDLYVEGSDVGFLGATLGAQWQDLTLSLSGTNLTNEQRSSDPNLGTFIQTRPRTVSVDFTYAF